MKKAGWSSILVAALLLTVGAMAEEQLLKKVPIDILSGGLSLAAAPRLHSNSKQYHCNKN